MMKARFLVLCAIALLAIIFPALPTLANPIHFRASVIDSRGVSSYKEHLIKLRSHQAIQLQELNNQIPENQVPENQAPENQIPESQISENQVPEKRGLPVDSEPEAEAESAFFSFRPFKGRKLTTDRSSNIQSDPLPRETVIQLIRQKFQHPSNERRNPYEVIAAAREQPNPLKGKNPFKGYKFSFPFPKEQQPHRSLISIQPTEASAAIRRRAVRLKESIPSTDSLPKLVEYPYQIARQTVEDIAVSMRTTLFNALKRAEQAAHQAAEQIKQS
ncbi:MAG: hypothetical protein AAF703_14675 [Cyanobacteria bacterium P01_D01_bin.105]